MYFPVKMGYGRADEADDLSGGDLLTDGHVGLEELMAVAVDVSPGQDFAVVAASGHGW
jgi:hypothetical protein